MDITPTRRATAGAPRVLGPDERAAAIGVLTHAFASEPATEVMFPDPQLRRRAWELVAAGAFDRATRHATVYGVDVDGALAAVAIWRPPGHGSGPPTPRDAMSLGAKVGLMVRQGPHTGRLALRYGRAFVRLGLARRDAVRAASRGRTWHLAFLATDPAQQGRGLARRLLKHVLDRCDADGLAAWLETTDPVNPPIYERFGFTTVAHLDQAAWLPGVWVMRREPDRVSGQGAQDEDQDP
jgi:GNAT superfamily N-acetyltransferase